MGTPAAVLCPPNMAGCFLYGPFALHTEPVVPNAGSVHAAQGRAPLTCTRHPNLGRGPPWPPARLSYWAVGPQTSAPLHHGRALPAMMAGRNGKQDGRPPPPPPVPTRHEAARNSLSPTHLPTSTGHPYSHTTGGLGLPWLGVGFLCACGPPLLLNQKPSKVSKLKCVRCLLFCALVTTRCVAVTPRPPPCPVAMALGGGGDRGAQLLPFPWLRGTWCVRRATVLWSRGV